MCDKCDWQAALNLVDDIKSLSDNVPERGEDFAAFVVEKATSIGETLEVAEHASEAQVTALENMLAGLAGKVDSMSDATTLESAVVEAAKDRRRAEVRREAILARMRRGEVIPASAYDETWEAEFAAYQRENEALDAILFDRMPPSPMSAEDMAATLQRVRNRRIES